MCVGGCLYIVVSQINQWSQFCGIISFSRPFFWGLEDSLVNAMKLKLTVLLRSRPLHIKLMAVFQKELCGDGSGER